MERALQYTPATSAANICSGFYMFDYTFLTFISQYNKRYKILKCRGG